MKKYLAILSAAFGLAATASAQSWIGTRMDDNVITSSTNFFNSSTWSNAPTGANFTENFVASGGIYNFTGNESFRSQTFSYGSGSLLNAMTVARTDGTTPQIAVDTSNSGFSSFDAAGSSKYLWITHSGGQSAIKFSFSQAINAFAMRMGDYGDGSSQFMDFNVSAGTNGSLMYYSATSKTPSDFQTYYGLTFGNMLWTFVGWTFPTPVTEISFSNNRDDNWGIDTVSFSTVPEPSAGALLLLGIGGLMALRRVRLHLV